MRSTRVASGGDLFATGVGTGPFPRTSSASADVDDVVGERASGLLELMQEWPKSRRWNRRARVGTRKPWYRLPEEVAHGSAVGGA